MSLTVAFAPRDPPLVPEAAAAVGPAARKLGERLLAMEEERLSRLRGLAGPDLLLILGEAESLPWVDEIAYLGRDASAPRLLLPTALCPDVPVSLFERALLARLSGRPGPFAVLAGPRRVVDTAAARRLERPLLEAWVSRCA